MKRRLLDVVSNGPKPVFRVTMRLGHSITVTDNHPLLTVDGWKELKDLMVGDFIAVPRSLQVLNPKQTVEPYRLIVLAALLSEGNTCHPSGVYVYNNNKDFIEDFVAHASQFELTKPTVTRRGRRYEVYAGTGQQTTFVKAQAPWNKGLSGYSRSGAHGSFPNLPRSGVRRWIEELGLAWVKSTEKSLPEAIFSLPNDQLALFLGRLWSGDGHVWTKSGSPLPFYATSSRQLAYQIRHLLLRLDIRSSVKGKQFNYRKTFRPGYAICISGKEQVLRFLDVLGPHMVGHEQSLRNLRGYYECVKSDQSSKDVVPSKIKVLVHTVKDRLGLTWDQLEQRSRVSMKEFCGGVKSYKHGFRRSTIQRLAEYLESPDLLRYATSDVYWDRIVSVEGLGLQETYDVEIEDTHNFIANDVVVHNSHSAAYALISYRTAYLKAHYPVEFMAALLTSEMGNTDKLVVYLEEAKRMGITILPPDVNQSVATFTVVNGRMLRCGLAIIKNVGMAAIESIVKARTEHGNFATIESLCEDIDLRLANRKVIESLIKAGACDSMGMSRAALLTRVDQALEEATARQRDKHRGQLTFLDALQAQEPAQRLLSQTSRLREWPESQKLAFEKALLGFYVSGHPLARFEKVLRALATVTSRKLLELPEETMVTVGGMLTKIKLTTTKRTNEQMAVCLLEDLEGEIEVLVFPGAFAQLAPQLKANAVVFVEGRVALRDDRPRLIAQQIVPLEQGTGRLAKAIELVLRTPGIERELLEQLKSLFGRFPGSVPIYLRLEIPKERAMHLKLAEDFKVEPRPELLEELERLLGEEGIVIRRQRPTEAPT